MPFETAYASPAILTSSPPALSPDARGNLEHQSITFISLLRAIASLLVVWDHLVGTWNDSSGHTFAPLTLSRQFVTKPLAIIQDFGYLGVALFFFVSGFIITHVALRESWIAFIAKRALRIYPPFIVSIIIIAGLTVANTSLTGEPNPFAGYSTAEYLRATTLWNYFCIPQNPVNGVAWTLVIEVVFYLCCFCTLPLLLRYSKSATLLVTAFCFLAIHNGSNYGDRFHLLAAVCGYLPLLLIGQVTYLLWCGRARFAGFLALLGVNGLVFVYGLQQIHTGFYPANNSYGVSTLYAYLFFVIAMLVSSWTRLPRFLQFYATISYSLYLYHGAIGLVLLSLIAPKIGYPIALAAVFAFVTGWSYLSWRFIEEPSRFAARRILKQIDGGAITVGAWPKLVSGAAIAIILASVFIVRMGHASKPPESQTGEQTASGTFDQLKVSVAAASQPSVAGDEVEGSLDAADTNTLAGWAWDRSKPEFRVAVAVYIDNQYVGAVIAEKPRDDLLAAGKGDGRHGYRARLPDLVRDGKPHSLVVKVPGMIGELAGGSRKVP